MLMNTFGTAVGALAMLAMIAIAGMLNGAESQRSTGPGDERAAASPQQPALVPVRESTPPPAAARLAPLSFLTGTWQGDMNGGFVEETWSAPHGTNMLGHFRWLRPDGSAAMFELLAITQEDDDVRLRLRHYSPTLDAKEPLDKPQTLKLAEQSASRALFRAEKDAGTLDRISYEVENDVLHISVEFVASEPPRLPLRFKLQRQPSR